jgi:argininosuccinate synthase
MKIVLAFSGGLDTSFCVPYLKETYGGPVYTVTVNTGGLHPSDVDQLEARSRELGATRHFTIDGRPHLFDALLGYLVKGNVLRGGLYPLSVGPERVTQAIKIVEVARQLGADAIAHGSTGAGNDQIRFDVAFHLLAPDLEIITPIRELGLTREQSTAYLKERGYDVAASTSTYSINKGLWGTTVGGKETHSTWEELPESAFGGTSASEGDEQELTISFEKGLPVAIDGVSMDGVALIEYLNEYGATFGVGRGMHVGDTVLGIKGRVGFEAAAAHILIQAHQELEKIVLTKWQQFHKKSMAEVYGLLLHEGQYFDPVMRDIEALLDSSQETVTGQVRLRLSKGRIQVTGCASEYSLFDASSAVYGEENGLWDAQDARGFGRIASLQSRLASQARTAKVAIEPTNGLQP